MTYEYGTDRVFRNFGTQNSDAWESPKRKNKISATRRMFAIKIFSYTCVLYALSTSLFLILSVTGAIYEVCRFET